MLNTEGDQFAGQRPEQQKKQREAKTFPVLYEVMCCEDNDTVSTSGQGASLEHTCTRKFFAPLAYCFDSATKELDIRVMSAMMKQVIQ
jgi:hypothetical protein